MASCDQVKLLIGPFDDGELEPHEMEEIAFHLVACSECKAILEDYRALGVSLRDAVVQPAVDGFVEAVQSRIANLPTPWRGRIARYLEWINEGFGAALLTGAAAAVAAILTFIAVGPSVSRLVSYAQHGDTPTTAAPDQSPRPEIASADDPSTLVHQAERVAADESQTLVEQIEADGPSVALWNEPRTDTTVIWVPNQQP